MTPSLENRRGTVRHECPHFLMFKTDLVLDSFLLPAMVSFFCRWIRIKPCGVSDIGTSWFLAEQLPPLISVFQVMRPFVELLTFFLWRVQILWWGFSYIHGDDFVACDTGGDLSAFLSKNLTPILQERTKEKERDFFPPPSLSPFSEHQLNSNMFPEYDQHMYLLILT